MLNNTPECPFSDPCKARLEPSRQRLIYSMMPSSWAAPENKRPEGTGETKHDRGHNGTSKTRQKNGFAADMIGQAVPMEHSDCLCSIMRRYLS